MEPTEVEDWYVDCSDDEKYSFPGGEKGIWEPAPQNIKEMYEKLAAGEQLTLTWSWPRGRRSPTPERLEENMQEDSAPKESQREEKQAPTEFDFDDFNDGPLTALTPRRTPGSKTPRSSQKRVARMDKIMDDLRKEKKSMSPGQKTMVPGHRPLPGLGGAHRLTPRAGMFSPGGQRSPGTAMAGVRPPGGPRSPGAAMARPSGGPRAHSPAVAARGHQQTTHRPPMSSGSSAANQDVMKQHTSAPASTGTVSSVSTTPSSGPAPTSVAKGSTAPTTSTTLTPSAEHSRPTQAVTLVPPPEDGTPQRPALPKLKIRKDLIS